MPSVRELKDFIQRADTIQKAVTAADWLKEHKNALSHHTFDELMQMVEERMKDIFRENWRKAFTSEGKLILVEVNTGEVIAEL